MDWINKIITQLDSYLNIAIAAVAHLGVLGAILLSASEAFVPAIPLVAIAGINVKNFGVIGGYLLTYVGSVGGTIIVFLLVRKLFKNSFHNSRFFKKFKQIDKFLHWIETSGFSSVLIALCIPFTPGSFINYACALSDMKFKQFLIMIGIAKVISIAYLCFLGNGIFSLLEKPLLAILAILSMIPLYYLGKYIEKKIEHEPGVN